MRCPYCKKPRPLQTFPDLGWQYYACEPCGWQIGEQIEKPKPKKSYVPDEVKAKIKANGKRHISHLSRVLGIPRTTIYRILAEE